MYAVTPYSKTIQLTIIQTNVSSDLFCTRRKGRRSISYLKVVALADVRILEILTFTFSISELFNFMGYESERRSKSRGFKGRLSCL